MESVVKGIPIADARWIGNRLGKLSAKQIGDSFRAAGSGSSGKLTTEKEEGPAVHDEIDISGRDTFSMNLVAA